MQFIDLETQYLQNKNLIDQRIHNVLEHGRYLNGPEITELEETLASYTGVKHCIAVSSGTDALLLAMLALGIKAGDEVITTPFTFFATAEMIALLGARPVFVDIDPRTYNINAELIEQAITPKTRAIMPVSLYGQCADMVRINEIASRYNIPVIEDGAQSFGALHHEQKSCSFNTIGCTSFYPSKPLACYGDGGACFTSDDALAKRMRELRNHGQDRTYHHVVLGINGRMDTIQAAILLAKFTLFAEELLARDTIAKQYNRLLQDYVQTPFVASHNTSVYGQYTIRVPQRDRLQAYLQQLNIPTAIHYPIPVNKQLALASVCEQKSYPIAEACAMEVLSLPMHPYLKAEQIESIANHIVEFVTDTDSDFASMAVQRGVNA